METSQIFTIRELNQIAKENSENGFVSLSYAFENLIPIYSTPEESRKIRTIIQICTLSYNPTESAYVNGFILPPYASYNVDDFSDAELEYLENVSNDIEQNILRARIFDILWLRKKKYQDGISSIKSYASIPISKEYFFIKAPQCIDRMLWLSERLYSKNKQERFKIYDLVINAILSINIEDFEYAFQLIETFLNSTPTPIYRRDELINTVEDFIEHLSHLEKPDPTTDFWLEKYINQLARISKKGTLPNSNVLDKCGKLTLQIAARCQDFTAISKYYQAINYFKQIPNSERDGYGTGKDIKLAETNMEKVRGHINSCLSPITTRSISLPDYSKQISDCFQNLNAADSLFSFATLLSDYDEERGMQKAKEDARKFHLYDLFPGYHISNDSRVIYKSNGLDPSSPPENNSDKIFEIACRDYFLDIDLKTYCLIYPALEFLHNNIHIPYVEFVKIAQSIPGISFSNYSLVAKGLHAGFNFDFASALHLLTFQLESFIRNTLKHNGVQTIAHDRQNIENEKGLSSLVKEPVFKSIFGNLAFEIEVLFTHPLGPNIRNSIAHGLSTADDFNSYSYIYAWWLILKIFVRIHRKITSSQGA